MRLNTKTLVDKVRYNSLAIAIAANRPYPVDGDAIPAKEEPEPAPEKEPEKIYIKSVDSAFYGIWVHYQVFYNKNTNSVEFKVVQ